ncbi:glycoside hydrolase family 18 protein [Sphaerisporangium sp. TRM90804]|uniref:glycoside hydrolase family 18 protein n=1 Tax=Sphaerisporangium sp. TRM90804 TaxID=3031113 RepID=UPI002446A1DB|nr:glycoside hydrolase family 18 protein [Sphaerisporangium sp. TRM90804]MDH2426860.1 glycoside hydrolase family 18 protein [Sphaerisporangium sp. TRM90804]
MRRPFQHLLTAALAVGLAAVAVPAPASADRADTASASAATGGGDRYKRVGYFIQWGVYGRNFHVKDVDTSGAAAKLTHINYAFGNVNAEGVCDSFDAWADWQRPVPAEQSVDGVADPAGQELNGNLNQLKKLKAKHPGLKVLISLGGWTGSKYFSDAVVTPESRARLAASCVDLWLKGDLTGQTAGTGAGVFDGIDLDWEWPGSDGAPGNVIRPEDRRNFTLFTAELRRQMKAFDARSELTAFLPAAAAKIDAGFEVREVFKLLDFATIQGYDLHGSWENRTGHNGNLFTDRRDPNPVKYSVDTTVRDYISRGAPARKIVVGVPAYGQGWTGVTSTGNGLWAPAAGPAPATWAPGTEDYKILVDKPGRRYRDLLTGANWLYDGNEFWSYDDPATLVEKAAYIRLKGLGGSMMWSLDQDDAKASLTSALYKVLR